VKLKDWFELVGLLLSLTLLVAGMMYVLHQLLQGVN
jgi:hypothetical protein